MTMLPKRCAICICILTLVLPGIGFTQQSNSANSPTNLRITSESDPVSQPIAGLVGWWALDEVSGTIAADSSDQHLNGRLQDFPGDNSEKIVGKVGGALNFQFGNYVNIPDPVNGYLDFGTGSFSVSLWIFPLDGTATGHECPLWKGAESGSAGYNISHPFNSGGTSANAKISDGSRSFRAAFGQKNLLNTWSLLTFVVNRTDNTLKTFVDGKYTGNSIDITGLGSVSNSKPLRLGMGNNWMPYNGGIDDVRIYNRALSAAEIRALFNNGSGRVVLTVFKDPASTGSGTVTGGSINCGDVCYQTVDRGSVIQLTASPKALSIVDSWSYPGCADGNTCTVALNEDANVTIKYRDLTEESKVVPAASCRVSDVQAAMALAKNGNTVRIPAGSCSGWGAGSLIIDKAITVEGSLDQNGAKQTILQIAEDAPRYLSGPIITLKAPATVKSLIIRTGTTGSKSGTAFNGASNGFRISDIQYINQAENGNGYFVYASAYGLIDSCDITGGSGSNELIFARGPSDSWQTNHSLGGADNLFIEDNVFRGNGYLTDCNSNSRCVVRYNLTHGPMKIDAHGKASNSPPRGVRHMEVYGNQWTNKSSSWAAIELRGGGGMVFNNRSTNGYLFLTEYAAKSAWPNFGRVIQTEADYPIDDQIGVGKDPKVGGSSPMYLWGNLQNGSAWSISLGWGPLPDYMPQVIAANRDYYNEKASFNGSQGVGVGSLSARPSQCSSGVAYWATDQGEWNSRHSGPDGRLYRCVSSNHWAPDYLPYAYPHPKRQDK